MTRKSRQHDIDSEAEAILRSAIAPWGRMEPDRDYGIDFMIQLFDEYSDGCASASGIFAALQLKGTENCIIRDGAVHFRGFPTRHLKHYLAMPVPVFLVVVDTTAKCGYYQYLQAFVHDRLGDASWRSRQTVTIRLPVEQQIARHGDWGTAIRQAARRTTDLRSTDARAALLAEKRRIEALDPRVEVTPRATLDGVVIDFSSRADLGGSVEFRGPPPDIQRASHDAFNMGRSVLAKDYGIDILLKGLPGCEQDPQPILGLSVTRSEAGSVRFFLGADNGPTQGELELNGTFVGGKQFLEMTAALPSEVFRVTASIDLTAGEKRRRLTVKMHTHPEIWIGKDVRVLPDFDRLKRLYIALTDNMDINCQLLLDGNIVGGGQITPDDSVTMLRFAEFVRAIDTARAVARLIDQPIIVPGILSANVLREPSIALDFLEGREIPIQLDGWQIDVEGDPSLGSQEPPRGIRFETETSQHQLSVWGTPIARGPVRVRTSSFDATHLRRLEDSPGDKFVVRIWSEDSIPGFAQRIAAPAETAIQEDCEGSDLGNTSDDPSPGAPRA